MKNILTIGRDLPIINQLLEQEGLQIVNNEPDCIVTHGGDGLLLEAERHYPGIPKLPIRRNSICKTCIDHDTSHAVKALARGTINRSTLPKLETTIKGQTYYALNEFSLHHVKPNQAIRFSVQINEEAHTNQAIGDGLVIATPFGSHAYYRSITSSTFRVGMGIAYNNTTESINHAVVLPNDRVNIAVVRGPAYIITDNDSTLPILETGENFEVKQSDETAVLLGLDHFRCPDCGEPIVPSPNGTKGFS